MVLVAIVSWASVRSTPFAVDRAFRILQFVSASLYSLGHGGNDAQKTMGIIAVLLYSQGHLGTEFSVPFWVVLSCQAAMALGTLMGGWRIVRTMGLRITKLTPMQGFCAETGGAVTLFMATFLGVPVSTTHTITGCIVGVVDRAGDHVKGFAKGDLVVGEGHITCGHCRNCLAGRRHLCPNASGVGVNRNGAWAEFVAIPQSNCWHADPSIPLDVLSCFDPMGNAVHTALSFDLVGEDVLITGAGPIGCMAIPICKHAGARHVVITDVNPYRLELAWKMKVDLALNVSTQKLTDAMKQLGMKEGFDVALEMSGNPKAFDDILPNMFHGGKIALLGIMPGSAAIDWNLVVFNQLTIKGIYGRELYETWYKTTALIKGGVDIRPLITHHFPYTQFKEGVELMKSGNSGKIILNWSEL